MIFTDRSYVKQRRDLNRAKTMVFFNKNIARRSGTPHPLSSTEACTLHNAHLIYASAKRLCVVVPLMTPLTFGTLVTVVKTKP